MPKLTLEFNLPEEAADSELAIHGSDWMCVCADLDNWLRGKIKHDHTLSEDTAKAYEAVRDYMCERMMDRNIEFV